MNELIYAFVLCLNVFFAVVNYAAGNFVLAAFGASAACFMLWVEIKEGVKSSVGGGKK